MVNIMERFIQDHKKIYKCWTIDTYNLRNLKMGVMYRRSVFFFLSPGSIPSFLSFASVV